MAAGMREYSIIPLVAGANETDQGVKTCLRDYGKRIRKEWMLKR
jgi:N-acyl homoserine lactone hydrolase